MSDFDYGNARLRAMRSRFLTAADYARLVSAASIDGLVAVLTDTAYGPDVEAALARYRGLRQVDEIIRHHLVRVLGAIQRFYDGSEARLVALLADRRDLQNLRIILRGRAQRSEEVQRLVVPAGRLSSSELSEIALQPSLRSTLDLMAAWRIPSGRAVRRLLDAWPQYESTGDSVVLEDALNAAFAERLGAVLGESEDGGAIALRSEIDETNLLIALRLGAARAAGEITAADAGSVEGYLPAGRIAVGDLSTVALMDDRAAVVTQLGRARLLPGWSAALVAWQDHGDLVTLTDDLRLATTEFAVGLFGGGDPLGFDIPVAFTRAQEHEAENLRWIARGVSHGLVPSEIERRVVVIT